MLESEQGPQLLDNITGVPRPLKVTRTLAKQVVDRCQNFHTDPDYETSDSEDE